jgi:hypothetical protein
MIHRYTHTLTLTDDNRIKAINKNVDVLQADEVKPVQSEARGRGEEMVLWASLAARQGQHQNATAGGIAVPQC